MKKLANLWAVTVIAFLLLSVLAAAMVEEFWSKYVPEMLKFVLRNVFRRSDLLPIAVGEKEGIHQDNAAAAGIVFVMANVAFVWWFMAAFRATSLVLCAVMAGAETLLHKCNEHRPQFRSAT